jgi:Na+/H+ antiporter NhaD/arsenite permease-like protein
MNFDLAWLSLTALFVAIVVSCTTKLNVGVLSTALAWLIGVYLGGFKVDEVAAGFPVQLFLTLAGVTLLFSQAHANGTLDKLAHKAVLGCRGNAGLIPVMFFLFGVCLASIGPGNIATAALLAPIAMAVAGRASISPFLMAIMVGNGSNAGALSPFAPTGIIANGIMAKIGMPGLEWQAYLTNVAAHATVAFGGYALFGGLRLFRVNYDCASEEVPEALDRNNWFTLAVIVSLILSVIFLKINVGMGAFAGATLLALLRAADHSEAIRKIPWNVIVMVCGVTILIALIEKTNGLALFTDLLAKVATKGTVTGVIAFITGMISVYSSTSGVVLPAFLPTVPGLAQQLGGADPVSIALSINVGSNLVDVSPLSTIGALCIAATPHTADVRRLFNQLLAWGLSMTVVGALVCLLFFG